MAGPAIAEPTVNDPITNDNRAILREFIVHLRLGIETRLAAQRGRRRQFEKSKLGRSLE
jgi:hypothetical protein